MALNRKAVKHPTKKGMGGHIRAQDWNYYPSDNPRIREFHKEHVEQSLARFEERRNKAIDAKVEEWQRNPPKSPEGYPHPEVRELGYWPGEDWRASSWRPMDILKVKKSKGKKKIRGNTGIGTASSSLKISNPNSAWNNPLNL